MKIYTKFILLFFAFTVTNLSAQLDSNNGSKNQGKIKGILLSNSKKVNKPKSITPNSNNGFKNAYEQEQKKITKKQAEEDFNKKGILTAEKIREENFSKSLKKINGLYFYPKIDQDLGSFRTESKSVLIICRDFQYPDGDKVTILVNDEPVIANIVLRRNYQRFNIPLKVGINRIAFKALNQGSSGPNTAGFKVFNDKNELISANEWNLATGAKATIVIAKNK
jgi:hypothetical protein